MKRVPLLVYLNNQERIVVPYGDKNMRAADFMAMIMSEQGLKPSRVGAATGLVHPRTHKVFKGESYSLSTTIQLLHVLGFEPKFVVEVE